jgi:hypothetical protein
VSLSSDRGQGLRRSAVLVRCTTRSSPRARRSILTRSRTDIYSYPGWRLAVHTSWNLWRLKSVAKSEGRRQEQEAGSEKQLGRGFARMNADLNRDKFQIRVYLRESAVGFCLSWAAIRNHIYDLPFFI